jgi:hypothetical protein
MANPGGLSKTELQTRLQVVRPEALLVKDRQFRQILARLRELGETVPMSLESPFWVKRDKLVQLRLIAEDQIPTTLDVLVLHTPEEWLDPEMKPEQVLRYYWRQLFRAALQKVSVSLQLPANVLREARFVLEQDLLIDSEYDEPTFQAIFLSVWLDLREFEPEQLEYTFPTLYRLQIASPAGLDVRQILEKSRLEGAAKPEERVKQDWHAEVEPETEPKSIASEPEAVTKRADEAENRGNWVRAAILNMRRPSGGQTAAKEAISRGLIPRLAQIMGWSQAEQKTWNSALQELLAPASHGFWPRAARCLYDLQKIVTDLKGELSTVDPIEALRSLGKRPIVRKLTLARQVILLRHLRTAEKHLVRSQIEPDSREQLERLLEAEMAKCEAQLRRDLSPIIQQVLNEVGFKPASPLEQVSQDKLIAELLDQICNKGYLRLSDLRDAVARNQLKLNNLSGPIELFRGDAILLADGKLAIALDGIYQRGEAYLRCLQRGSAMTFGTPLGRWLSKYVALPFGGALMMVEFSKYIRHEFVQVSGFVLKQFGMGPVRTEDFLGSLGGSAISAAHHATLHHGSPFSAGSLSVVFCLGVLLLLLIHVPQARSVALEVFRLIWRVLRLGIVDLPQQIWSSRIMLALRHNPLMRSFNYHCGTALFSSMALGIALTLYPGNPDLTWRACLGCFLAITMFSATPVGRRLESMLADWSSALWRDLSINLIQGLLSWLLWTFQRIASYIERWLYSVDEWLRFREGDSKGSLWLKVVLALIWFPIAYLFRFSFYLLIEPQVNPVKHFPVVTVGHKLILPLTPQLGELIGSNWLAGGIVSGIPGIFGFIAWELKENWRLYAANRTEGWPELPLGHHGETLAGLLQPGFHSGTVPKLFSKLRKLFRKADRTGHPQPVGRAIHELHEIQHALELFVEREWLATLRIAGIELEQGHPIVNVQGVILELVKGDQSLKLAFENSSGSIRAEILRDELLGLLKVEEQDLVKISLVGVCNLVGANSPSQLQTISRTEWSNAWDSAPCATSNTEVSHG